MAHIELQLKARINGNGLKERVTRKSTFAIQRDITEFFFNSDKFNFALEVKLSQFEKGRIVLIKALSCDGDIKEVQEYKFSVSEPQDFMDFLEKLDFKPLCMIHKKVEVYFYKNIEIELCSIQELGEFIELKVIGKDEHVKDKKEEIINLVKELKINHKDIEPRSYYVLIKEKENVGRT